jgi:hypothetical protein
MRALLLIFSVQPPKSLNPVLKDSLEFILKTCKQYQEHKQKEKQEAEKLKAQEAETGTFVTTCVVSMSSNFVHK